MDNKIEDLKPKEKEDNTEIIVNDDNKSESDNKNANEIEEVNKSEKAIETEELEEDKIEVTLETDDLETDISKKKMIHQIKELLREKNTDLAVKIILSILIIFLLIILLLLATRIGITGVSTEQYGFEGIQTQLIEVNEDDLEISKNTELNIFKNTKYDGEEKIAPGSYGSYEYTIKNLVEADIKYDMNFVEISNFDVNMKYRIKMDNVYIRGDKDTYIDVEDLAIEDILVIKDSVTVFTIEWYWDHSDIQDTIVGESSAERIQHYVLNIGIEAEYANTNY